eukprot:CAMPEP_0195507578 /NCGR_PEP_ID=MMETSP0794_2-20130614/1000_1 /TAXON_ID=515487 /ORGANISM="Stephanopyxis turris, Strain CCMP 815" /LENGTH=605 /DNA_ID=CAMNT_0040634313 /DNA_START=164 /DNA_END=1981 /DNA_ORIENTATION=-
MHLSISLTTAAALLILPDTIKGHGHMLSPRSRNWVAYEDGTTQSGTGGVPLKEYCYYCLNTKAADDICGIGGAQSYDDWIDSNGDPMPWNSQATYTEGEIIEIKSNLHTPHWGHQDVMICPDGDASTQDCFEAHPLEFIEDVTYGAPKDPQNPTRGHFTGAHVDFTMRFKLPMGVTGDRVMMQWRYVTANNCWPPGYENYPYDQAKGGNSLECIYPLDPTGATGTGKPEQFWNCAEISILPNGPTTPTAPTPTPPAPTPNPPPVPVPTTSGPACCSWPPYEECTQPENTWCHASQSNCENSCSGQWLGSAPQPTPAPVLAPPSPVPPTTPSPVLQPTDERGCCSINFKSCHHPVDTFCWESEENCRGSCGKYWLPTGEIDGCTAQWEVCTNDNECCGPMTCGNGECGADGWNYTPAPVPSPEISLTPAPTQFPMSNPTKGPSNIPTKSPSTQLPTKNPVAPICRSWCDSNTSSWGKKCGWPNCAGCPDCTDPTASPITAPTTTPTVSPTNSPTNSPTTTVVTGSPSKQPSIENEFCCTWDFFHCGIDSWCNENESNCHSGCGGAWIKKSSAAMQCIAKWEECTGEVGKCCDSLMCIGNEKYKQCV